jgi:hypothetical protein
MITTFLPGRIYKFVDQFKLRLQDEIPRHIERWGGAFDPDMNEHWTPSPNFSTFEQWEGFVADFKTFAWERVPFAKAHVQAKFGLSGMENLEISYNEKDKGYVKMYHKNVPQEGYIGPHFRDALIVVRAVPKAGFEFSHWEIRDRGELEVIEETELELILEGETKVKAYFYNKDFSLQPRVIINEINYNSPDTPNSGDWVELYNNTDDFIDISDWKVMDEDDEHVFTLVSGQEIEPRGYLVVCENMDDFTAVHPEVDNIVGDLGFKFSNGGEVIRLYDQDEELIDSVRYDDVDPWPELPDGNGPTLELINPELNNDLPSSWTASVPLGSPGRINHTITALPEFENPDESGVHLFLNYPNPVSAVVTFSFSIDQPGNATLKIIDLIGKDVTTVLSANLSGGDHHIEYDVSPLPSGIYVYALQVDDRLIGTRKMIVNH